MIRLDDARGAVLDAVGARWHAEQGELMIDDDAIFEDDGYYIIGYGAREWIMGEDFRYARAGDPVAVVAKADGTVSFHRGGPPPLSDFDEKFPNRRRVPPSN